MFGLCCHVSNTPHRCFAIKKPVRLWRNHLHVIDIDVLTTDVRPRSRNYLRVPRYATVFKAMVRTPAAMLVALLPCIGGPVEFGMSEYQAALAARHLSPAYFRITAELDTNAPETFRIQGRHVFGGDLRGLMYGLLEAAEQIRLTGRLAPQGGKPTVAIRGVRIIAGDLNQHPADYWRALFAMLARNRLNRITLVVNDLDQLASFRSISQTAADFDVDLVLAMPSAFHLSALKTVLGECPGVRAIEVNGTTDREGLFNVIRDAGRRVSLEFRAPIDRSLADAAIASGIPVRVAPDYWPGGIGRPYQPAISSAGYGDLLEKGRTYEVFWELHGPGRILLWGDADYVRRALPTFTLGGADGFEIEPPDLDSGPIFSEPHNNRESWRWNFERYWLFYQLWGRLSYDPKTPDRIWIAELQRRFGPAAQDVWDVYRSAGRIEPEIVATRFGAPDQPASPETDAGGTLEEYARAHPGDTETITNAGNVTEGMRSGKQAPSDTAAVLNGYAAATEQAIARVDARLKGSNPEWNSSKADFQALTLLARYHAARQSSAEASLDNGSAALDHAMAQMRAARAAWEKLATISDELYAPPFNRHRDELAGIDRQLKRIEDAAATAKPLGTYIYAFHFGEWMPGFRSIVANTTYTDDAGSGWSDGANRLLRVKTGGGTFEAVLIEADQSTTTQTLEAVNGMIDIPVPTGAVTLVIRGSRPKSDRITVRRPAISHAPPSTATANEPLKLTLSIAPFTGIRAIRLHYRAVNQSVEFKTLEAPPARATFVVPAAEISARWDLMYYFEVLSDDQTWIIPDAHLATPYYVVKVESLPQPQPPKTIAAAGRNIWIALLRPNNER